MLNISLLFIFSTLYYIFNREHLRLPLKDRVYLKKYKILLDILYFTTELFYFLWLIFLYFYNIKFALILTFLILVNWLLNRKNNAKVDYSFSYIKIIVFISMLIG
jgi:hypothetical protein